LDNEKVTGIQEKMVIENLEEENGQPQNQERQEKIDIRDIV
jgi:hypothetical protein